MGDQNPNEENIEASIETIISTVREDLKQRRYDFGFNGLKVVLHLSQLDDQKQKMKL